MNRYVTDTQALIKFLNGKKVINDIADSIFRKTDEGENIIVTSDDKKRFAIPIASKTDKSIDPLVAYLKQEAAHASVDVVLRGQMDPLQTTVTIAADQHLKYFHLRPIFAAMGEAGISRYAFETKLLLNEAAAEGNEKL